jgi:hypothetical protein
MITHIDIFISHIDTVILHVDTVIRKVGHSIPFRLNLAVCSL